MTAELFSVGSCG